VKLLHSQDVEVAIFLVFSALSEGVGPRMAVRYARWLFRVGDGPRAIEEQILWL